MYHGGLLRLVHFDPAIVSVYHGFIRRSLICRASLALMFSDCRHPRFRYFGSNLQNSNFLSLCYELHNLKFLS